MPNDPILDYCKWAVGPRPLVAKLTFYGLCALLWNLLWFLLPDGNIVGKVAVAILVGTAAANVAEFGLWWLMYRETKANDAR